MSRPEPASAVVTADGTTLAGAPSTGLYQIGSVTKVFTGLLLAGEVVGGALSLDQPVSDLLPDLVGVAAGRVSLRSLVTHTSGLPRLPPGMWRKAFGEGARDPYADIDATAVLAAVRAARLSGAGGRPVYSNLGFGLLGHALATHLGTSYDEAVRSRVTGPLGMSDTGCAPSDPARVVVGTRRRGKPYDRAWTLDAMAGAGALWSTVDDLTVFLRAQLAPGDDELGAAIRLSHETLVRDRRVQVAMAWMRLSERRKEVEPSRDPGKDGSLLWHNGGTAGYRSFVGVDHGRHRGVVVLGSSDRSVDRRGMDLARG